MSRKARATRCPVIRPASADVMPAPDVPQLQKEYAEAVIYRNEGGTCTAFGEKDRAANRREAMTHSVSKSEVLALKPEQDDAEWCTPFWMAESTTEVPEGEAEIPIKWLACFSNGYAHTDVCNGWWPVCSGYEDKPSGRKYHRFTTRCVRSGRGHSLMFDTVKRDSVVMYKVGLSKTRSIIEKAHRTEFWKLRKELKTHGGIPSSWNPAADK